MEDKEIKVENGKRVDERRRMLAVSLYASLVILAVFMVALVVQLFVDSARQGRLEYVSAACPCGVHTDDGTKLMCQICTPKAAP